ncbi:MAG: Mitochondrial small ribosomal subunit Rsm22 [Lacunisphaera sp.]|nr:Mitochondrial small ribosomal subunit Rsm22 [Lacunisphaera sp.]
MNWESLDWEVLDRLRENFLTGPAGGPYWHTITDLECYDFTYGERIGWKWDAVLRELKMHGWKPPANPTLLDWGCGSGIAGRRVVEFFGAASFFRLVLHDHSALALDFAEHAARKTFPSLSLERASTRFLRGDESIGVLVISHVLNELDDNARAELRELAARAETILWVEPGTHEVSRLLGSWREKLISEFRVVAPCTHAAACGMFAPGNERHWCHFFAAPPVGVLADSGWVRFGQRAGIDLRSLPYSFLVLDRRVFPVGRALRPTVRDEDVGDKPRPTEDTGFARIIGEPRHYKGYAKIFGCSAEGVADLTLQKRDAPAIFKALKHADGPLIYRWTRVGDRVKDVTPAL